MALAFSDNTRQGYIRDGKKRFVPSVSGPDNLIKSETEEEPVGFVIVELNLIHSRVSENAKLKKSSFLDLWM